MAELTLYQVDAFTDTLFTGNPAAVCPLESWPDDDLLQKIAEENNLSETAFFVPEADGYRLRWFTPVEEVDLCGHATLASAHVLFKHLGYQHEQIRFQTRSGELLVSRADKGYLMDFPVTIPEVTEPPSALLQGSGVVPVAVLKAFDYILVLENEEQVRSLTPDHNLWKDLDARGVLVTAAGNSVDFVSRCFFPGLNVNEDPVTGSAHCELAPYWSKKLQKTTLLAKQLSSRGGTVHCDIRGERIFLTGNAVDYMKAVIYIG